LKKRIKKATKVRTTKSTARKPARRVTKVQKPAAAARARAAKATPAMARKIAGFALEKKAADVVVMDLRKITDMTSFFVVCTGSTTSQVRAIADHVLDSCARARLDVYHVEGYDAMRWVLIDMVDIVVHVFLPDVRAYYQLERLWGDAPSQRVQDGVAEARP
jgi:ribosome-associated protein